MELLGGFMATVLVTIAALLPITNPPGNAPIFLSLTDGLTLEERATMARRVATNCFALLVAATFVGSHILAFFDISLAVVRVGGGLLVAATAWRLLTAEDSSPVEVPATAPRDHRNIEGKAFYPISFPITVGPGSISIAITLGAAMPPKGLPALVNSVASVMGIFAVALAIYYAYRFAQKFVKVLGETGTIVFLRLSAFILLCIGVQICWDGLSELLAPWKPK